MINIMVWNAAECIIAGNRTEGVWYEEHAYPHFLQQGVKCTPTVCTADYVKVTVKKSRTPPLLATKLRPRFLISLDSMPISLDLRPISLQ
jgi:hypothetical protein